MSSSSATPAAISTFNAIRSCGLYAAGSVVVPLMFSRKSDTTAAALR